MTEQTKHFIELSDAISFRFECPDCHSSAVIPLVKFMSVPRFCPNGCGKQWEELHSRSMSESVSDLVNSIHAVERITLHRGLLFSVEIAKPEKQIEQGK